MAAGLKPAAELAVPDEQEGGVRGPRQQGTRRDVTLPGRAGERVFLAENEIAVFSF